MEGHNNLLGEKEVKNAVLREKYGCPPFTVIDTRNGEWQRRRKMWYNLGIKSEFKGGGQAYNVNINDVNKKETEAAVFDPVLCEIMYKWYCTEGGKILEPFSGSSNSGIIAQYLGFKFTGIDIREEQILENYRQARTVLPENNLPDWRVGDSNVVLDDVIMEEEFELLFSCPPYGDLVKYSKIEGDISRLKYNDFLKVYNSIIYKSCLCLKSGGYAIFVIGEFRDKNGNYYGFVPDTIDCFNNAGMIYYNEAILINRSGSAAMRAEGNMKNRKLVKTHQNILIFKKP